MMDMRKTCFMTLKYQPTAWERIGGPWAITLRAYLWSALLGVFFQPLVEPGFLSGNESAIAWLLVSIIGYLAFGLILYLGNRFIAPTREVKPVNGILVLVIGMLAGVARSITIGSLIPIFGLTGIGPVERLPFGSLVGIFWIVTAALIMDTKHRYRKQIDELVTHQKSALEIQKAYIFKFTEAIKATSSAELDEINYQLQKVFRDLAVKASLPNSDWAKIAGQIYRAVTDMILVSRRPLHVSELPESEYVSEPKEALRIISRTPLFNIPAVISSYSIVIVLASARILPIWQAAPKLAIGLFVNGFILVVGKRAIHRGKGDSSFGYIAMCLVLILLAIVGPEFSVDSPLTVRQLQIFALAGTSIEIIWLLSSGMLLLSQLNRQKIVDRATAENELLHSENEYWQTIEAQVVATDYSPIVALDLVATNLRRYLDSDQPAETPGAIQVARSLMFEIKFVRREIEDFSLAAEFSRIEHTWGAEVNLLWTTNGLDTSEEIARKAIAVVEISILRILRLGQASLISIDLNAAVDEIQLSIADNGTPHGEAGAAMGIVMVAELTNGTYQSSRVGALTIATATIS